MWAYPVVATIDWVVTSWEQQVKHAMIEHLHSVVAADVDAE